VSFNTMPEQRSVAKFQNAIDALAELLVPTFVSEGAARSAEVQIRDTSLGSG